MLLEVCVDSIQSAIAAQQGGASRIELCTALSEGGLTPSIGILKTLKLLLKSRIPIFCMLRPRGGNDFIYSNEEIQSILYDMEMFRQIGCDGFVFGALNADNKINIEQCKTVVKNAGDIPVTFHRAFDLTNKNEMHKTCEIIKSIGFKRILTSGFEESAETGIPYLRDLISQHKDIIIMPGAGITPSNLNKILKETNCREFHASAKVKRIQNIRSNVTMSNVENIFVTDSEVVHNLLKIAQISDR